MNPRLEGNVERTSKSALAAEREQVAEKNGVTKDLDGF